MGSLTKILKCAKDSDELTLRANDDADTLGLVFQNGTSDRLGEYEMKLMDIDQEHLGIPDTDYDATVTFSSAEFARICRDLSALGESVRIDANKEGVRFTCEGEIGNGSILLKPTGSAKSTEKVKKRVDSDDEDEEKPAIDDEEEDDEVKPKVEDGEVEAPASESEEEPEEDEEKPETKKRKKAAAANGRATTSKRAKKATAEGETDTDAVSILLQQAVSLTFSLKYLQNFAKSAPLASNVILNMSNEVPLLVAFEFEQGHVNFYLAPKIGDE